jgi:hypothetical protein
VSQPKEGEPIMTAWPATQDIQAACYWNETGIRLEAGRTYDFIAEGNWTDLTITSGPEGNPNPVWSQRIVERYLRAPGQRYFTLIGTLDRDPATIFPIGTRLLGWAPPRAGQLTCFANDVPMMYWNNRGSVRLSVAPAA